MTESPPLPIDDIPTRQGEVLAFIQKRYAETGCRPLSYRDISDHFEFSYMTARNHVARLSRRGLLTYTPKLSNSIRPTSDS